MAEGDGRPAHFFKPRRGGGWRTRGFAPREEVWRDEDEEDVYVSDPRARNAPVETQWCLLAAIVGVIVVLVFALNAFLDSPAGGGRRADGGARREAPGVASTAPEEADGGAASQEGVGLFTISGGEAKPVKPDTAAGLDL